MQQECHIWFSIRTSTCVYLFACLLFVVCQEVNKGVAVEKLPKLPLSSEQETAETDIASPGQPGIT